jgi:hypothetical protein
MSGLLIGVGAVTLVAGAVMIGFGIPINEFSFGNTLIAAGTTAFVGGLIVIGLGLVLAQLQRIAEALGSRTPIRSSRPLDMFVAGADVRNSPPPARIPFPTRAKADLAARELHPIEPDKDLAAEPELPMGEPPVETAAPTLRNPDETPVTVEDEVSLSPQHPNGVNASAADQGDHDHAGGADRDEPRGRDDYAPPFSFRSDTAEKRHSPMVDSDWQSAPPPPAFAPLRQPHTTYFDAMWPADSKPAKSPASVVEAKAAPNFEPNFEPKFEPTSHEGTEAAEPADAPAPVDEPRAVAILKSGVVDGMGYTLYVDGSIEAELPDGTLRFASINELRSHLEKNP